MPAKTLNKSDFIRAQPATMSAAEVIAKGKAEGIKIGSSLVYMVRGRSSPAKKGASKKTSAPTSATVTSAAPKSAVPSKTPAKPPKSKADFVRANADLSVKDLVGKALFDGIGLTENYVYRVRAMDKTSRKAKRASTEPARSIPAAVNGARPALALPAGSSSAEDLIRAVAAEIGLGRAIEILAGERERVRLVIGG